MKMQDVANSYYRKHLGNKKHIIRTKLIHYFRKLKMCNIIVQQNITWQNELINYKDENRNLYLTVYLKTIHKQELICKGWFQL